MNRSHRSHRGWWLLAGTALVALFAWLRWLSGFFAYEAEPAGRPVLTLVGVMMLAGAVYVAAVWGLRRCQGTGLLLGWIFLVGVALRVLMAPTPPILEDDHYRYLWDGAVTAHGFNPYAYTPHAVWNADPEAGDVPPELADLPAASGHVIGRINHGWYTTIYPVGAQGAFWLAYRLGPWELMAWRAVLLACDAITLVLVVLILRHLRLPAVLVAAYWWNPLLVKEIVNGVHMDMLVLPLVLGAVLLAMRGWIVPAAGVLGLGVGMKLWPVLLVPVLLRPVWNRPRQLVPAVLLFGAVAAAMVLPMLLTSPAEAAGYRAYARSWSANSALYNAVLWGAEQYFRLQGLHPGHGAWLARFVLLEALAVCVIVAAWRPWTDGTDLCRRCLIVVAGLFLLSPVQFPWYYVWLLPLLAVRPRLSLLVLTALLPIYYLRHAFEAVRLKEVFDTYVVWLEYVPVWYLLVRQWIAGRRVLPAGGEPAA